jgi:hypothetical protein
MQKLREGGAPLACDPPPTAFDFGLNIGFIDDTELQAITVPSLITAVTAKSFPACCVFTWQRLLTVGILQLHTLKSSLHSLPYRSDSVAQIIFLITSSIFPCLSVAAVTSLQSRCLEMNVISESFASNGYFSGSVILALSRYVTIKRARCYVTPKLRYE